MIAERDHTIAVMVNQLDALKRIEQESRVQSRLLRPSMLTAPSAEGAKK